MSDEDDKNKFHILHKPAPSPLYKPVKGFVKQQKQTEEKGKPKESKE